jgi:hypothetical protein
LIDRNCDATILSGASDRRLAVAAIDYARSTRDRLGIQASQTDLGALLHHDIPFLAAIAGATMNDAERASNPHLSGTRSRDRSIADSARHVMRSTAFSAAMPDNGLLSDPIRGNVAALLLDRVARMAAVARIDEDGPRDALAAHMVAESVRRGAGLIPEWSPGWAEAPGDPQADVRAYARCCFGLDDRQLAAEVLDQARDVRTRLAIDDDGGPQASVLWQGIPAMASLFGARLMPGEALSFSRGAEARDDQQSFAIASSMVAASLDGAAFLEGRGATIGEHALFSSVESGSTSVILLDRSARALDADRGGSDDPVGRAVAAARRLQGLSSDATWQPEERPRLRQDIGLALRTFDGPGY